MQLLIIKIIFLESKQLINQKIIPSIKLINNTDIFYCKISKQVKIQFSVIAIPEPVISWFRLSDNMRIVPNGYKYNVCKYFINFKI